MSLPYPRPAWASRLDRLRAADGGGATSVILVSALNNIRYLTGFAGTAGLLLVRHDGAELLIDGRYDGLVRDGQARGTIGAVDVHRIRGRYDTALAERLRELHVDRVAFEADHVTVATLRRWQADLPQIGFAPVSGAVERLRLIKDDAELAIFRDAAARLSRVADQLCNLVRRGHTERQVAFAIEGALRNAGFEKPAFDTIVAAGPNSAYPHARPTDRAIEAGDLVVLDFGGVLDGYCVDLTRAACAAPVSEAAQRLYHAVRAAQDAAIAAVGPDVPAADVDAAARAVLEARGFGDAFMHGTGHGLGLDIHEAPHVSPAHTSAGERLAAGMVATMEPGAYVVGVGGVRLEDDVLVTPAGCEVLTTASRDLLVV